MQDLSAIEIDNECEEKLEELRNEIVDLKEQLAKFDDLESQVIYFKK